MILHFLIAGLMLQAQTMHALLGLNMGNLQVRFSHTIPILCNTVPVPDLKLTRYVMKPVVSVTPVVY